MKLLAIQLENYRSHEALKLDLSGNSSTVVIGKNGRGKTNLLEAVYLLSLGKSFRVTDYQELVNWQHDFARINGEIEVETTFGPQKIEHEVFFSRKPIRSRSLKINGIKQKATEFIGNFPTVLFQPEDLNILYLSPSLRRNYLDTVLSQVDRNYLQALILYQKVLKQRNALLSKMRSEKFKTFSIPQPLINDLEIWDSQLKKYGVQVIATRLKFLRYVGSQISEKYQQISHQKEQVECDYLCALKKFNFNEITSVSDEKLPETLSELFSNSLQERHDLEIMKGVSLVGPHRDDFTFKISGSLIQNSASRGEFRTVLLALKFIEIDFIALNKKVFPLLLLDDVFSELDESRQEYLLKSIASLPAIITTTHLEPQLERNMSDMKIVRM